MCGGALQRCAGVGMQRKGCTASQSASSSNSTTREGVWVGVWVGGVGGCGDNCGMRIVRAGGEIQCSVCRILDLTATHEGRCFIFEVKRMPSQERTICRTSSYYDS